MEKLMFYELNHEKYIGIITILDYEIRLSNCLAELSFSPGADNGKKVIVDLALKSGLNQYRFVDFAVDKNGEIILNSNQYVHITNELESIANILLQKKKDMVLNSILTDSKKAEILNMYSIT